MILVLEKAMKANHIRVGEGTMNLYLHCHLRVGHINQWKLNSFTYLVYMTINHLFSLVGFCEHSLRDNLACIHFVSVSVDELIAVSKTTL